ncbi:MAG: hypothetical protein UCN61_06270, partial [Ruminococcus sp.]|nr:hypothetical protein [Ruminococcus sp.]
GQRFARIFFARRGEGRRKAVALQGRQRSIAENRPQRLSIFYLSLVLEMPYIIFLKAYSYFNMPNYKVSKKEKFSSKYEQKIKNIKYTLYT